MATMRLLSLIQLQQTSPPTSTRPFYTMPNQENPSYSTPMISSLAVEVLSGSQHIHDAIFLKKKMREAKINLR